MFLKSEKYDKIEIKVAPCLKFPYVCKSSLPFSGTNNLGNHSNSYGTMLFKEDSCNRVRYRLRHRTFFRTKNNVILYYNNFFGDKEFPSKIEYDKYNLFWFIIDVARDIYQPVEIPKLNYLTGKNRSLLVRLKDKFYVLSKELYPKESLSNKDVPIYVAIIDADSGEALFLENRKRNLYLDLYYPIANRIVPILQFNEKGLFLHLVDILDNKINTVAWTIEEIKMIIIDLINRDINFKYVREEVSKDPIEQVSTAQVSYVNYIYDAIRESINNHVKSLNIHFELLIKGKMYEYNLEKCGMVIVLEHESIRCYLDLQHATFVLNKKKVSLFENHYQETMILLQEIPISPKIPEICLSNVLYSNKCYDILYSTTDGITITKKKRDIIWSRISDIIYGDSNFTSSAIYRRENYLFIFKLPNDKDPSCLVIIDLKAEKLYPFVSTGVFKTLLNRIPYHSLEYVFHYFKLNNKIVFLSKDLIYVFAINIKKLDKRLVMIKQDDCKEQHYEYLEDFVEAFEMKHLLSDAISLTYEAKIENDKIKALSYYIDKNLDKLYIAASYDIDSTVYIGLFELILSVKGMFLRLVAYYPYEHVFYYKNKNLINLSHSTIHKIYTADTVNDNLEIVCNLNPALIDIKNNRVSIRITLKDFISEKVTCRNLNDVLIVELQYKRVSGLRVPIVESNSFVISRLNLVSKMSILSLGTV